MKMGARTKRTGRCPRQQTISAPVASPDRAAMPRPPHGCRR